MNIFYRWYKDYLTDPQVVIFILIGLGIIVVFSTMGQFLTPVIASLVIAYVLEGLVRPLEQRKVPRIFAVIVVFTLFMLVLVFLIVGLIPLLSKQISQFLQDLPQMITSWQDQLHTLPKRYPQVVTESQINKVMDFITGQITSLGQNFLSFSLASVRSMINIVVYMVLVPLMVFFLLKDKMKIIHYLQGFLPENIALANQVWQEMNHKIARFIQGKIWEILIVWGMSYIVFALLELKFSVLLSFLVGLSVIVPYVGATVMTIPVALVAFFQWGWTAQFAYAILSYLIIQFLDGNILVPLLMSGIVNLHPMAIIIGILVFGGFWGFWGVFFAIPLATLVHAIVKAWPRKRQQAQAKEQLPE